MSIKTRYKLLVVLAIAAFVSFLAGFFFTMYYSASESYVTHLEDDWYVKRGYKVYTNVTAPDFVFDENVAKGETVVMRRTFKEDEENVTLQVLLWLSSANIYVDDELVYEYGEAIRQKGDFLGSGYHQIYVDGPVKGKELVIEYTPGEDVHTRHLPTTEMTRMTNGTTGIFGSRSINIFIALFLFCFGLNLVIATTFCIGYSKKFMPLFLIAIFSLIIGIWGTANNMGLQIFSLDYVANMEIEFASFDLTVLPLLLLPLIIKPEMSKRRSRFMFGLLLVNCLVILGGMILHFTNTLHLVEFNPYFNYLGMIDLLAGGLIFKTRNVKLVLYEKLFMAGYFTALFDCIVELFRYNLRYEAYPGVVWIRDSFLCYGAIIVVWIFITGFIFYLYSESTKEIKSMFAVTRPYEDETTGFYTAKKGEMILENLIVNKPEQFCIICFNIKKEAKNVPESVAVETDMVARAFTNILFQAFPSVTNMVRTGEDDFMVIVEEDVIKITEAGMHRMHHLISGTKIKFEMEYGIAYNFEVGSDNPMDVKSRALEKMRR